ncbi:Lsr2 family DNA-binding protein [Brachybacterium tyrofermentans]|uniref:Lsr2 family DNA-binding protein n=1 Tax=Brachybacterium tyrofermentans TaxID=47848 RepID=UPI003FD2383F
MKTTQISDALAASRGQVQLSGDHTPETAAYAELLLSSLQDGVLSAEERADLEQLARTQGVSAEDIHDVHQALITGLADLVIDSGRVPRSERQELIKVAEQLGIDQKEVVTASKQAEIRRFTRLSAATKPLPPGWRLGEPLRVGDRVAFTGDAGDRDRQEADAARRGLRVTGSVSGRTDVLVWDGEMVGGKLSKARTHGTCIVAPSEFDLLLANLQPSLDMAPPSHSPVGRSTKTASAREQHISAGERAAAAPPHSAPKPADVREWALENGISVAERGRLSTSLVERYLAAQEQSSSIDQ